MSTAFTLFGQAVSWLEGIAFVTGLLSVWLIQRMHIWTWPVGLVNVACLGWLFVDARLYAVALLQIVFAVLGLWGWWQWAHDRAPDGAPPVTRTTAREALTTALLCVPLVAAGAWALQRYTDNPAPLADTAILVLSIAATAGQALRRLEAWWVWIAVDAVSMPLYWQRGLPLTALLFGLFLLLCVAGLRSWTQRWHTQQGARTAPAEPA